MKYIIFVILALSAVQLQAQQDPISGFCVGPIVKLPKTTDTDAIIDGVLYKTERNSQCRYLHCPQRQCSSKKIYRHDYCYMHCLKHQRRGQSVLMPTCGHHMGNNIYCDLPCSMPGACIIHAGAKEKPLPIKRQ